MAIIAITQQIGSCGNQIAEITAKMLGYRLLLGRELANSASTRYNVTPEQLQVIDERKPHFWERLTTDSQSFLAFLRAVLLKEIADDRLVVIGRAIAHHLPDSRAGIRVHVIGALAERVARVAAEEQLSQAAAEKRVAHYDREIRSRVQTTGAVDIEDPALYGLVLNGSRLAPEVAAAGLITAAREIESRTTADDLRQLRDAAIEAQVRAALHAHPQLQSTPIGVQCRDGAVRVNGPGLVPPWDGLTDQVVRQVEGVTSVEIVAEAAPILLRPE